MRALALILILAGCAQESAAPVERAPTQQASNPAPKQEEEKAQPIRLSDEQLDRMGRDYERRLRTQECIRDVSRCPPTRYRYTPPPPPLEIHTTSDDGGQAIVAADRQRQLERRIEQIEMDRHLDEMARINRRPI